MKIKDIIAMILICGGLISTLVCVVAAFIFSIKNPDMTEMRRLLEYPEPVIIGMISLIAARVGVKLLED